MRIMYFHTPSKLIIDRLPVPAAGYRNATSGALNNRGTNVYFWAASPRVAGAGYFGNFNSGNVNTANSSNGSRAYGLSVRSRAFTK